MLLARTGHQYQTVGALGVCFDVEPVEVSEAHGGSFAVGLLIPSLKWGILEIRNLRKVV